jgi:hypothetical protein
MKAEVFVVSECCPVGCGFEVLLLRARHSGVIFAYCNGCGCTWSDPAAARFDRGLNEITPAYVLARDGAELPSRADVIGAGFEMSVLRAVPVSDPWRAVVEELNVQIGREGAVNPRLKIDVENPRLSGSLMRHA